MTAADFVLLLPEIRRVARILGYAVATHGSMARDFDIVAIPWTEDAVHPNHVARAIMFAAGGVPRLAIGQDKPHGRYTFAFSWDRENYDNKDYCDLSIMSRKAK